MRRLLRWLRAVPERRAFLEGAGSVFDLGGAWRLPRIMVYCVRPRERVVRAGWEAAMADLEKELREGRGR
jgi:hypothetical protein